MSIIYLHFYSFLFRHYTQRCIVFWSKTALADSHGVNHQSYAFHPQQQFREKTALCSPLAACSADCWLFLWCKPLCLQIQTPLVGRGCPCTPQHVPLLPGIDAEKTKVEKNWNFQVLRVWVDYTIWTGFNSDVISVLHVGKRYSPDKSLSSKNVLGKPINRVNSTIRLSKNWSQQLVFQNWMKREEVIAQRNGSSRQKRF